MRERAAAQFAELLVLIQLILDDSIAIFLETFQRGNLRRKNFIHQAAFLIPMILEGGGGEIGLGFESVVEASFIDAGPAADVIDADGTVTTLPDEHNGRIQEFLSGITLALHEGSLVDWLV